MPEGVRALASAPSPSWRRPSWRTSTNASSGSLNGTGIPYMCSRLPQTASHGHHPAGSAYSIRDRDASIRFLRFLNIGAHSHGEDHGRGTTRMAVYRGCGHRSSITDAHVARLPLCWQRPPRARRATRANSHTPANRACCRKSVRWGKRSHCAAAIPRSQAYLDQLAEGVDTGCNEK